MNKFYNPVKVCQGYGAVKNLSEVIKELDIQRGNILFLIWNECIIENKDIKAVIAENSNIEFKTIIFTKSNPDTEDLFRLYMETKNEDFSLVVAIGGGSVMDMGKSLCCLYGNTINSEEELRQGIKGNAFVKPGCKWVGVPTTAGTGSEVTCWATVWNNIENSKLSLESKYNYAYAALADPQFASTMPVSLAVSSALDAAAHATEAYWAKTSNFISKTYSLRAISLIMNNIMDLFDEDRQEAAHNYMSRGSVFAGLAFSNTKTTACHSLSYPLTLKYHIPHGTAVSMLIEPVMKVNLEIVDGKEDLLSAYGVKSIDELGSKIKSILQYAGIPDRLHLWGAEREEIAELAVSCRTKGRIDNNPVDLSEETIVNILNSIF
ncbi:MAG: phosphonoacetaldehyde reductase [Clostridia bacterium]|nr:phosphonoacetaldehyde reductase [Clostridia bacterium]